MQTATTLAPRLRRGHHAPDVSARSASPRRFKVKEWIVPALLVVLGLVPAFGGINRISEVTGGASITPENARFFAAPLPVLIHVPAAMLYSLLGAFQFTPALRRRNRWHKIAGRILLPAAVLVAVTGLWMTIAYPWPDHDGLGVYLERLVFGTMMLASVVLGIDAIRRRKYAEHGEWMIRAYAIGMGAGTQVLTHLPWFILVDLHPGRFPRALMMGSAWVINVVVAEWIIRRSRVRSGGVAVSSAMSAPTRGRLAFSADRTR